MNGFEQQAIAALVLLVAALFVSAGMPVAPRWRKRFKMAAIGGFILALVAVIGEIARWAIVGPR